MGRLGIPAEKIRNRESGLCLFSFTPPRLDTSPEKLDRINRRRVERLKTISPDGIMIYDVQDEEERTVTSRTYSGHKYLNTIEYGETLGKYAAYPQIRFAALSGYSKETLVSLFDENAATPLVPVGYPGPEVTGTVSIQDAYSLYSQKERNFPIGGIAIAERHLTLRDEAEAMLFKISRGVDFFVSQCIYNTDIVIRLLEDYKKACVCRNTDCRPVIFSFSPVLDEKDIEFFKWLGIGIPEDFRESFRSSETKEDFVRRYISSAIENIINCCKSEGIPWGLNFESIIGRKKEMDSAVLMAGKEFRKYGEKVPAAGVF